MRYILLVIALVMGCAPEEKIITLAPRSFINGIAPVNLDVGSEFVKATVFTGCMEDLYYIFCMWEHSMTEYTDFQPICTSEHHCDPLSKHPVGVFINATSRVQTNSTSFELVISSTKIKSVIITGARIVVKEP